MIQPLWRFLKKLGVELPEDLATPLLGVYPEENKIKEHTCTPALTAAQLRNAQAWKQPRRPSTDEWIKKQWHVYTIECYSAIKRNIFEPFC